MTFELKRISLWPLAKISFLIFVIIFLIIGILYGSVMGVFMAMVGGLADNFAGDLGIPLDGGLGLGGVAMFFFAIFASFFGAVFYSIVAVLIGVIYNALASMLGGIELELEEKDVYIHPRGKRPIPMEYVQGTGASGINQQQNVNSTNLHTDPVDTEVKTAENPEEDHNFYSSDNDSSEEEKTDY